MKIRYEFVNGEVSEIEVDEGLGELLVDFDRQQYNNDHKETRRHVSLDGMDYEGELFTSAEDTERELLLKVYFEDQRIVDIARAEGVTKQSVHERLKRAIHKLKIFLR